MRGRLVGWLVVLAVVGAALTAGVLRYQPFDPVGTGREVTSSLTLTEGDGDIERLVGGHEPGATFVVAQPLRNIQNLPVRVTAVSARDRLGQSLFLLDDARYVPGTPDLDVVDATGEPLESVEVGGGVAVTLLLTFRHVEPCVEWAPSIGDARSTLEITYELFGLERHDSIALDHPIEIVAGADGWTPAGPCTPDVAAR